MSPEEMEAAYLDGRLSYQDMQAIVGDELEALDKLLGGKVGDAMELIVEAGKSAADSRLTDLVMKLDRPDLMLIVVAKLAAAFIKADGSATWFGLLAVPLWELTDG